MKCSYYDTCTLIIADKHWNKVVAAWTVVPTISKIVQNCLVLTKTHFVKNSAIKSEKSCKMSNFHQNMLPILNKKGPKLVTLQNSLPCSATTFLARKTIILLMNISCFGVLYLFDKKCNWKKVYGTRERRAKQFIKYDLHAISP